MDSAINGGSVEKKRALICGVTGQDGAYLAQLLLLKGYHVWGTSRRQHPAIDGGVGICKLGIDDAITLITLDPQDREKVKEVVENIIPNEIYFLSGQSSVVASFMNPVEAQASIGIGSINFLETIRELDLGVRFFNAGSGDCFGDTGDLPANENTPFFPRNPYAVAKASSILNTKIYREVYGLFVCSGILFNHESPLRPSKFVTKKIVDAVCRIYKGSEERLKLGNIDVYRDWGWAPEYVEVMWKMLQLESPQDYVIASGRLTSLRELVSVAFAELGMDWLDHVDVDFSLKRQFEPLKICADNSRAMADLSWKPEIYGADVAKKMVAERLMELNNGAE